MIATRKGHLMVVAVLIKYMHEYLNNRYITRKKELNTFQNENRLAFSQLPYALCFPTNTEVSDRINETFLNAYHYKHVPIMQFLLEYGVNVQIQFRNSLTLLIHAISEGEYEIVNLLLTNGAQVHKRSNFGVQPLRLAALRGHTDIVTLLLKHESNTNSRYRRLQNPLTSLEYIWIQQNSYESEIKKYTAIADNDGNALICAMHSGSLEFIELLFQENNIYINSQTNMGRTALMIACGSSREKVVELLLHNKADVNIRSKLGATALDIALVGRYRNENIIRALLRRVPTYSKNPIAYPGVHQIRSEVHSFDSEIVLHRIWCFIQIITILLFLIRVGSIMNKIH